MKVNELLIAAFAFLAGAGTAAAAEVRHAAPEPAETLVIPAGPVPAPITFQSKLSSEAYDEIEAYVWKPEGASAAAKVPLVIVAHGHSGIWSDGDPTKIQTQFTSLAAQLYERGIGMMLVDSFTEKRHDEILSRHGGDASWGIYPDGLGAKDKRDDLVSDHLSRPWDLFGAAAAVPTKVTWADPDRVVAIGYSHGGSAVLALGLSKHPVNLNNPLTGAKLFAKLYPTYPGCGLGGTNTYYKYSGAVVPLSLATGSADATTPPGTMPGEAASGYCRARYDQAKAAAASNAALLRIDWWNYTDATHSWESSNTAPNTAARTHWRAKLIDEVLALP